MLGIVDPENIRGMPPQVAACTGLDVLSHAVRSLTASPFDRRPAPESPERQPDYQGSNPISNIWATRASEMIARFLVRSMTDPSDDEARRATLLEATFAGIGFGNAGVHQPHGMSNPVSGMVRRFIPAVYCAPRPLIPHGMSVILNSPVVFRFTAPADPERHFWAARLIEANIASARTEDAGTIIADTIIALMRQTGMPNGFSTFGYTPDVVDALVVGTVVQHRVNKPSSAPPAKPS